VRSVREHPDLQWASIYRHWLDHTWPRRCSTSTGEPNPPCRTSPPRRRHHDRKRTRRGPGSILLARLDLSDGEILQAERRARRSPHSSASALSQQPSQPSTS
jgi:hypothetical protein